MRSLIVLIKTKLQHGQATLSIVHKTVRIEDDIIALTRLRLLLAEEAHDNANEIQGPIFKSGYLDIGTTY